MTRETITSIISGAAGLLSVLGILLLLYIVVCNVFLNHDGHTEKVFGKKESSKSGQSLPIVLPIVMGIVMLLINIIVHYTQHGGLYTNIETGFFSVLSADEALFSTWNIVLCIVSIACIVAGSMIFDKVGGKKHSILFCLNIALSLMVLPSFYSVVALMWALGYFAIRKKNYLLLVVAAGIAIAVHFPASSFNMGELFMLAYLALIPVMAQADKEQFKFLTVALSLASGIFAVFTQLILR